MASKHYLLVQIIAIFVIFCLTGVRGQRVCYQCNSYTDLHGRACLDPMSPDVPTITCPNNYVCTRVSYVTQKIFITSRSCDPPNDTCNSIRRNLQGMYPDLAGFSCSTCKTNYCNSNSGAILNVSLAFIFVSAILSNLYFFI